jgi:hypothetical protein
MLYLKSKENKNFGFGTMQDDFVIAREKWLTAKAHFDQALQLLESISRIVEFQHKELNDAFSEFSIQQAKRIHELKNSKGVKEVPRKGK